jgi:hypothetical protein
MLIELSSLIRFDLRFSTKAGTYPFSKKNSWSVCSETLDIGNSMSTALTRQFWRENNKQKKISQILSPCRGLAPLGAGFLWSRIRRHGLRPNLEKGSGQPGCRRLDSGRHGPVPGDHPRLDADYDHPALHAPIEKTDQMNEGDPVGGRVILADLPSVDDENAAGFMPSNRRVDDQDMGRAEPANDARGVFRCLPGVEDLKLLESPSL